jgi:diguanylate cyclase (GGDEF)-like protein/PAS domain S-box-containing protein
LVINRFVSEIANSLYESDHIMLMVTDRDSNIVMCNPHALKSLGYTQGELCGKHVRILHLDEDAFETFMRNARAVFERNEIGSFEYPFRRKDGRIIHLHLSGKPIDPEGHKLWSAIDITDRKQMEQEMLQLKERLEFAIEANRDAVWDWDILNDTLEISDHWKAIVGYDRNDVTYTTKNWVRHVHPDDRPMVLRKIYACLKGKNKYLDATYRLQHKNGTTLWILVRALTFYDQEGRAVRMVGTHRDITHTKDLEMRLHEQTQQIRLQRDRLWHSAHHDVLTDLPNRVYFNLLLQEAIDEAHRLEKMVALFFVDVDHFKKINDTYGHHAGDRVLRHVADILRSSIRSDDHVSRLGGDEFTLIIRNLTDARQTHLLAKKLLNRFAEPFDLPDGTTLSLSASIGIALYPQHGTDVQSLLHHADNAMYRVKTTGRNGYALYERS